MGNVLINHLKIHFDLSFEMLEKQIDNCPDILWNEKLGGFVFWQQLLHAFTGILFWTRENKGNFIEPFADRQVYPELEKEPIGCITKEEMKTFAEKVKNQKDIFFTNKDDEWLLNQNVIYDKILNIDIIAGQIRHMQYHIGHCDGSLMDRKIKTVEWIDYFG